MGRPPPCGWHTIPYAASGWSGDTPTPAAAAWAEAHGLRLIWPGDADPPFEAAMVSAFPTALNNCHPICKAPACGQ